MRELAAVRLTEGETSSINWPPAGGGWRRSRLGVVNHSPTTLSQPMAGQLPPAGAEKEHND
ncbi:hypothetical protein MCC01954_01950 [Bifidobacteriaceae bacterium MCC01954]|nr:hypothetical protein MCC01954_01950 [Bifidobacteriaceae bacterium MCC01954]